MHSVLHTARCIRLKKRCDQRGGICSSRVRAQHRSRRLPACSLRQQTIFTGSAETNECTDTMYVHVVEASCADDETFVDSCAVCRQHFDIIAGFNGAPVFVCPEQTCIKIGVWKLSGRLCREVPHAPRGVMTTARACRAIHSSDAAGAAASPLKQHSGMW